jgi:hypothetical protein
VGSLILQVPASFAFHRSEPKAVESGDDSTRTENRSFSGKNAKVGRVTAIPNCNP